LREQYEKDKAEWESVNGPLEKKTRKKKTDGKKKKADDGVDDDADDASDADE